MGIINLTVIEKKDDIMHLDIVEKFNPYHDAKGRFTSARGAASFTIGGKGKGQQTAIANEKKRHQVVPNGTGSTKVDMGDIAEGKHSLQKHVDKNGKLTAERERLHDEIVMRALDGIEKAQGQQTFYMMGGGPASGKSTVIKQGAVEVPDNKKAAYIDPDWCKAQLPEYQAMVKAGDKSAAAFCHEESSALAKRISTAAQKNGYNVVYDGTGDGSVKSVEKKLTEAKANGLVTKGVYVTVPTEVAWQRSQARAAKTGREVPEATVKGTHKKVSQILPEVAHMFDGGVQLFSTDGEVKLIAEGGKGKGLTAKDEKLYAEFLAKANE
jgi:predicted ABC-type ATPase